MIKFRTANLNIWYYFNLITYYEMWELVTDLKNCSVCLRKKRGNKIEAFEYAKPTLDMAELFN